MYQRCLELGISTFLWYLWIYKGKNVKQMVPHYSTHTETDLDIKILAYDMQLIKGNFKAYI